jgi:glycosyltransferase involved in cell wall biosynthesis
MRFHVVSLPHTHTTAAFPSCAFTQKVIRFCQMMKARGHHVTLYSGEQNEAPCDEHVPCISEKRRKEIIGKGHYTQAPWDHPYWEGFNANVIGQMHERIEEQDFICLIGGTSHKPIADAFPDHLSVEFGIGYAGTFSHWRVFESYAWMHMIYGVESGAPERKDGHWFDAVIPNQIDPKLFPEGKGDGGYYLYVGRLVDRKGFAIAQEVCRILGKRLILAGPGLPQNYGEFVGEVDAAKRAELMAGAIALFAPTQYIEPFGTVTIEAMACGTPVICTDWGAFTETIEHGRDGYRCRTLAEFIEAAKKVVDLPRIGIRRRALDRFSMDVVGEQYETYFNRLMALWGKGWYELGEKGQEPDDKED